MNEDSSVDFEKCFTSKFEIIEATEEKNDELIKGKGITLINSHIFFTNETF